MQNVEIQMEDKIFDFLVVILVFDFLLLHSVYDPASQHLIAIIEHNGLPWGYRLLWLSEMNINGVIPEAKGSVRLS